MLYTSSEGDWYNPNEIETETDDDEELHNLLKKGCSGILEGKEIEQLKLLFFEQTIEDRTKSIYRARHSIFPNDESSKSSVQFSKYHLDFNLKEGEKCKVGVTLKDKIKINSTGTGKTSFNFCNIPVHSPNIKLSFTPSSGVIKKGSSVEINVEMVVLCTTRVRELIAVDVANSGRHFFTIKIDSKMSQVLDYKELEIGNVIGGGGYGAIYKAKWRGLSVAVKVISELSDGSEFEKELEMHKELLHHPNIVHFVGFCVSPKCLVLEYIEGGSLDKYLHNPLYTFTPQLRLKMACDIAKGMCFLHRNEILHLDLKPQNFLVVSISPEAPVSIKLADFGLATSSSRSFYGPTVEGSFLYMSPEVFTQKKFSRAADVWSYGACLIEILTNKRPYQEYDQLGYLELARVREEGLPPLIPPEIEGDLRKIIEACFHRDHTKRPSFENIEAFLDVMTEGLFGSSVESSSTSISNLISSSPSSSSTTSSSSSSSNSNNSSPSTNNVTSAPVPQLKHSGSFLFSKLQQQQTQQQPIVPNNINSNNNNNIVIPPTNPTQSPPTTPRRAGTPSPPFSLPSTLLQQHQQNKLQQQQELQHSSSPPAYSPPPVPTNTSSNNNKPVVPARNFLSNSNNSLSPPPVSAPSATATNATNDPIVKVSRAMTEVTVSDSQKTAGLPARSVTISTSSFVKPIVLSDQQQQPQQPQQDEKQNSINITNNSGAPINYNSHRPLPTPPALNHSNSNNNFSNNVSPSKPIVNNINNNQTSPTRTIPTSSQNTPISTRPKPITTSSSSTPQLPIGGPNHMLHRPPIRAASSFEIKNNHLNLSSSPVDLFSSSPATFEMSVENEDLTKLIELRSRTLKCLKVLYYSFLDTIKSFSEIKELKDCIELGQKIRNFKKDVEVQCIEHLKLGWEVIHEQTKKIINKPHLAVYPSPHPSNFDGETYNKVVQFRDAAVIVGESALDGLFYLMLQLLPSHNNYRVPILDVTVSSNDKIPEKDLIVKIAKIARSLKS